MGLPDKEEETQRAFISAAMVASNIPHQDAWHRYTEYTGRLDAFAIDAYLAGLVSLPLEECNILAHAINELIDEQPPPLRAPHRGTTYWSMGGPSSAGHDPGLDELFKQWLLNPSGDETRHWRKP